MSDDRAGSRIDDSTLNKGEEMTTINTRVSLSRELIHAYPKRVRTLDPSPFNIKIDDQDSSDVSHGFCTISVSIDNNHSTDFILLLRNAPADQDVIDLVEEMDGECEEEKYGHAIKIEMTIRDAPKVRRLAKVIHKTVGRGKRYIDSNWIWQARRASNSLEAFAKVLANAYRHARGLESIE